VFTEVDALRLNHAAVWMNRAASPPPAAAAAAAAAAATAAAGHSRESNSEAARSASREIVMAQQDLNTGNIRVAAVRM